MPDSGEKSPILILPDDEMRKKQLQKKLEEYEKRKDPFKHPGLQMSNICKIEVLSRLLKDGRVITFDLANEMFDRYGSYFDIDSFNVACGVIKDYCETGGKVVSGGTGLPAVQ